MDITLRRFCKLYTIVLLVFIVEATGNSSNDTSHERRQSRVTGRIVKLYTGTRPEPILCAGEGFQADSHDCAVFYRCMKSGSGKYTVFRFQCGPGTVYDPETEVCNHPRSTKRSECGGLSPPPAAAVDQLNNNEIEGTQNEIPSPITNKPIRIESTTGPKATFTTVYPWTASSSTILAHSSTKRQTPEVSMVFTSSFPWGSTMGHTNVDHTVNPLILLQNSVIQNQQFTMVSKTTSPPTTSAIPQSNSRDNICTSDGFMGDSENCRKFYRCVGNQRGTYTRFEFSCSESTVWDDDTQSCNHAWAVKRSRCGRSNQDNQFITNAEIPQKDSSTDKTIQQQLQVSFGSKVTQTQTQISNGSVIQNQTQINYGDRINQNKGTKAKQNQTQISHGSAVSQTQTQIDYSDKGVQTQLQIDHSQQASQTQIQVHESTTAKPLTSTASSTSHVDTQEGNRCERSGFMGDTNDCKKFYRCIDNGRGGYTKFEFSCGEGTVWDQSIEACNHAWAVKDCGGKGSAETTSTTQAAISTSHSTQNYYTTVSTDNNHHTTSEVIDTEDNEDSGYGHQNQNPTSSSTTSSSTTWSSTTWSLTTVGSTTEKSPSNGNCQSSGFIGDANDCKIFYRCVENGRGSFTKYEFKCGEGTVWDSNLEACNHAWAVKTCGGTASSDINKVETTTEQQNTISTAHTQSPVVTPSPTDSAATQNDDSDTGYGSANNDFTSSTTTTTKQTPNQEPSMGTVCTSSGFMGNENDCKRFYRCVDNGNGGYTRYEFTCGEGTVWDSKIEACNHAWAVKTCGGTISSDINKVETTTGQQITISTAHTQSPVVTPSPTDSAATQNDDYDTGYGSANNDFTSSTTTTTKQIPNQEPSMGTVCTSSGFMGDENDCKRFYRCVDNGNGGYTRYEFTCGEGTVWDSKIEACNHAWAVEKCGGSSVDHQEATTHAKPTTTHEVVDSSTTEGAQSTGSSTLQSSITSSTSTITESVTMTSNDCTKSGFMGDQKDCKKFYRCVDNGKGSFTKYEFSCGEGTVWDQKIEACNHAWAVEKCGGTADSSTSHHETTTQYHPTMSDEIDNGYPSNIDTGSEITTQSTTTHSTTESSKQPSEGNNCINSGFIGDKNDCKKFYRCVDDGSGKYIRYEFICGDGTVWDQSIEACDHAWAVKDCGKTGNNTAQTSSESPTQGTLTTETEDQGYPQSTEKTSTSMVSSYPDSETGEACSKEGFMGDKRNCKKFYRCVDNGRGGFTKYEFTCGEGTYWSQEILSCDHTTSDKTCGEKESGSSTQTSQPEHDEIYTEATSMSSSSTEGNINEHQTQQPPASSGTCTSEGFYGDQNDCKKFYRCVDNGKGGYTKYDFTCGDGTVWDQEIQACNHESSNKKCSTGSPPIAQTTENQPEPGNDISMTTASQIQHSTEKTETSSASSSYQCSSEGFFADPNDCKKFLRCVSNDKGGFTKYEFTCGEGTIWVQDIQACDHDNGDAICSSETTNKPLTTEGHQQTTEKNELGTSTSEPQTIDKQEDEYDNGNSDKPSQSGSGVCSSEGFYGNENDCRQFYRCVNNGQGGYTKHDFTCGDGTAWDAELQNCNHIDQVKTCNGASETQPVMHDEDNSPSTESSSTSSSSTTSSGTTSSGTTSSGATSSSSTSSSTPDSGSNQDTTSDNKDTCENEGYFGNSQDCKKFYRCVDNGKGSYTKYDYDCGEGTIWDQDVTTCNHPQDVVNPSCNQNQDGSTTSTTSASSSSSGESSSTSESSSSSDSSPSTSSSSQTTTESSHGSSNCSQEDGSKKPAKQNITCDKAGYFANPNDCKKFYRCVDWDGDGKRFSVYHFDCGEGTIWDPAVETCNHEESVYPPRDCSGSQSQSENQPATEGTTTTQQETTSSQDSTSTQTTSTTQSSTEPTTQSTTSAPTTTQQSTSSEKTTTQKSTTSEQTTTQKVTTSEQTTQHSTTSEPTTPQSTTSEQTTQQSTTSEQTTQKPSSSEQTTTQQSTTSEQTTTQQYTTSEQTTTQQSTTSEQTTTQQSTTSEQTTTEQSTTSEQTTTQQSTTSEQTTQEPTTSEQTTQASTTTEQSTTSEQTTTEQSTTSESTTEQSTSTTESSTTEQSTTQQSTTNEQSEQSTTEESTSSEGTTTEQSSTQQSTIEQTTESSTTESSTDESTSEKKCPETDENQSLFVCPTSFKRHPKYCNLFYQCDEDDDTHDVKIAVFTCPNNTIYDESQTRCVEENKADKKCDGKIAQKRRFKRLDRNYKEPLVVTKESHACPSAGYFSFEKDSECSPAFLKCKTDKTNKLRGLVYQCPSGYVYWSISKRCEPMDRVRDCKRSQNNWTGRWEIPTERRNVAPS